MKNIFLRIWQELMGEPTKREQKEQPRHWVHTRDGVAPGEPPKDLRERFVIHHLRRSEPPEEWIW